MLVLNGASHLAMMEHVAHWGDIRRAGRPTWGANADITEGSRNHDLESRQPSLNARRIFLRRGLNTRGGKAP